MKHQPLYFGSLDARTIQYKYAIYKLERLVRAIDELLNESTSHPESVVLVQYIVHLSSTLFAINEQKFGPRLAALENFKPVKAVNVSVTSVVTHVPYDPKDLEVTPLSEMPLRETTIQAATALRKTAENCLEGYQKRLTNAEREIGNEHLCSDLDNLIASMFNPPADIDVSLQAEDLPIPAFLFPIDQEYLESPDGMEALLIDIDLHALFVLTRLVLRIIRYHRIPLAKFKELKAAPKQSQKALLDAMPQAGYALHRVLVWAIRLNDLYTVVRRFGRQIYLSNYHHLHDAKFLSHMSNVVAFKTQTLKTIEDLFTTAKKNGVLVATITRFIRLNSRIEISPKVISEFFGFIGQSFVLVETLAKALEQLGKAWITAEISFRNAHTLPSKNLLKINEVNENERLEMVRKQNEKKLKDLALQKEKARAAGVASPPQKQKATERMKIFLPPSEKIEVKLPLPLPAPLPTKEKLLPVKDLLPSKEKALPQEPAKRTSSLTNESIGNVRNRNGSITRRPNSQIFLSLDTASINSAETPSQSDSVDKRLAVNTTAGRKRSNSLPISFNAAAAALSSNSQKNGNGLRSPTGSIRRNPSLTRSNNAPEITSPLANKTAQLTPLEEDTEPVSAPKLTANQKFALHLKEASKSGLIHSQQRETLTSVVFDPNNPSATKIQRTTETKVAPVPETPLVPASDESALPLKKGPPTRAQITKLNTQRNSVVFKEEVKPRLSGDSASSTTITVLSDTPTKDSTLSAEGPIVKKVRFTGVPEYTPEEDAPTRLHRGLMKNFAFFKQPIMTNRYGALFKSRDNLLKKEESLLFREQAHPR